MNTRLRFLLTVMTAVLLLLAGCGRDTETVKKRYLANGEKYLAQGKTKEATIMFRNAIKRDPKFGDAYARLGDAEVKRGELMAAMRAYQRAVELQPNPEDSAGKLADIYLIAYSADTKRDPRWLEEVSLLSGQLLKKNPKSYHGLRLKGFLAVANSDLPAAEEAFRQADQVKPKQPELLFALAQLLNRRNNWEEAERLLTQITKDSPTYNQVYDFLVLEYMRRNEAAKAEQILAQKVANNPKIMDFRISQARFYLSNDRKEQADKVLAEMMAKESDDPAIREKVGDFLATTSEFDRALEVFKTGAEKYPAQKTAYRLRTAQLFLAQGKPKDAVGVVDQALADDPKSNDALSMRASLQLQYGGKEQRQGAVSDLQALIGRDPKNVVVRYNLARAYHANGELDAARVQYNEVIKLSERFVAAYVGSGQVALAQRNFVRAIQDADAILKMDARNSRGRLIKANALIQSGNLRQARQDIGEFLKDDPESPDLNFQIALADFGEGKYKEAEGRFRTLRAKFPSDLRLVFAEAEVMVRTNRGAEALQLLKAERSKHPDDRSLRLGLASLSARSGDFASAEAEYRALLQSDPKNLEMYMRLGELLRSHGQLPAAIDILKKGQQLAPTNPGANLQLALTLDAAGQKAQALPLYESVVKLDPENPVALNNLAFQYAELGKDLDLAMKFAQKAKQKVPGSDDVSDTMGWVYVKKQLNDEAIAVFRDLIKRQPNNALYHYHLGYALYQKGNKPDARQSLQTALRLKPGKEARPSSGSYWGRSDRLAGAPGSLSSLKTGLPWAGPFAVFVLLLAVAPRLGPATRVTLAAWVVIVAAAIFLFSRDVLEFRPARPWASLAVGIAVFAVWVAPDLLFPGWRDSILFQNPLTGKLSSSLGANALADPVALALRSGRAILIVPIVEELFWRGWLMRWIERPDFDAVPLGHYHRNSFWLVAILFAMEHGPYWDVGFLAGAGYNWWMVRTRRLSDLILAHAVTNACLCAFVLVTGRWEFWL